MENDKKDEREDISKSEKEKKSVCESDSELNNTSKLSQNERKIERECGSKNPICRVVESVRWI